MADTKAVVGKRSLMGRLRMRYLLWFGWLMRHGQAIKLVAKLSVLISIMGVAVVVINTSKETEFTNLSKAYENLVLTKTVKESELNKTGGKLKEAEEMIASMAAELEGLKNRDEYKINVELEKEVGEINSTYKMGMRVYEKLVAFEDDLGRNDILEKEFVKGLVVLADRKYSEAEDKFKFVEGEIDGKRAELAKKAAEEAAKQEVQVAVNNSPPGSGYSSQWVQSEVGTFRVDMIAGDLGSTRVIVDTASEGTCGNECPVLSLGDYVARNGAYAGVNGSYFCPASYPSCAGKTNSFDTLLMNKNKAYFNSDNNVYSVVPAVVFGDGWIRFVEKSLEWGRDTSIDSMIANQPLLLSGGNVAFGGDGDPKKDNRSGRSFVANRGNVVYIGVVRSATVVEAAKTLKALGMENGLNLDSGGSTALWFGGYKAGPGRNIPNAILFVRK